MKVSARQMSNVSIVVWAVAWLIERIPNLREAIEGNYFSLALWFVFGGLFGGTLIAGLLLSIRDTKRLSDARQRIAWRVAIVGLPPLGHWSYWLFGPGRTASER